jgi:hypothetical protein
MRVRIGTIAASHRFDLKEIKSNRLSAPPEADDKFYVA